MDPIIRRLGSGLVLLLLGACLVACGDDDDDDGPASPAGAVAPADAAVLVPIPRSRIALAAPTGMSVDGSLPGLVRPGTRTTVLVSELPKGAASTEKILSDLTFGTPSSEQGLQLGERRRIEVDGHPAVAATGTQTTGGQSYDKAVVFVVTDDVLISMTGTIEAGDALGSAELLDVLAGADVLAEPNPGELTFDLTAAPGYLRQPGTTSITFSLNGETGPGVPVFIASPSIGQVVVDPAREREFSEERFRRLPPSPSADTVEPVEIAGLRGWEITGTGRGTEQVYATFLFTDDGYIGLVGSSDPRRAPDQIPAFREMARSLVLK